MLDDTRAVTHQTAVSWEIAPIVNRGHRMAGSKSDEFDSSAIEQCVICHKECACPLGHKHCKGRFEISFGAGSKDVNLESQALAAAYTSFVDGSAEGSSGLTNSAITMDEAKLMQ